MKLTRRNFLGLIGLARGAVIAAKLPALPAPVAEPTYLNVLWKQGFTYFGDGSVERFIPHSLGFAPTFMLIKKTDGWHSYPTTKAEAYLKSMKEERK